MQAVIALLALLGAASAKTNPQTQGTNVNVWSCTGSVDQQWAVGALDDPSDPSSHPITSKTTGLCIDISDYGTSDGSNIWVFECHPDDKAKNHLNQWWAVNATGPTTKFVAHMSGKCLTVNAPLGTAAVGSNVVLGECSGPNAEWTVDASTGAITSILKGRAGEALCLDAGDTIDRPCTPPYDQYPFCNVSLTIDERVDDLVSRINVSDYPGLFQNGMNAIPPPLAIPAYQVWSEATHGVGHSPGVNFSPPTPNATSFPEPILTSCSFNITLFNAVGNAVSTEAAAMYNVGHAGQTFWAPNINIARDPRWGRIQETPGEDPYLSGRWAINYVRGLQEGDDPRFLKTSADCKHFAAYDMEDSDGFTRHNFPANVTPQDLHDTYLPHFQDCVMTGRVSSIMGSYNAVRILGRDTIAIPSNANKYLLTTVLREAWGFAPFQYVTSDCGAVSNVYSEHHYTNTTDATNYAVLAAGMSIDCGGFMDKYLGAALQDGAVAKDLAMKALTDVFGIRFRLGQFDPLEEQPYRQIGLDALNSAQNQELALDAARQGIVLLKNSGALPLSASAVKTATVIGPNMNATTSMLGNYAGAAFRFVSPSAGVASYVPSLVQSAGCSDTKCGSTSGFADAVAAAAKGDAVFLVIGDDESICGEGHDRTNITLPGNQAALVTQVAAAAKAADKSKPVIVAVMSGEPLDLGFARDDANVDAILWFGYPGMLGGQALADIMFGTVVPAGRLSTTFLPASFTDEVIMINMNMRPGKCDFGESPCTNPGHTHRFYTGSPVFAFGHGLSYTTFTYEWMNFSASVRPAAVLEEIVEGKPSMAHVPPTDSLDDFESFEVKVTNTGKLAADDAVLCFVVPPGAGTDGTPLQELAAFKRIHLGPGESKVVTFGVSARHFLLADEEGRPEVRKGDWTVRVGVADETYLRLGGTAPITKVVTVA